MQSALFVNNAWVYRQNICMEVMESIHSGVLVNNAWVYRQNSCTEVIKSIDSSVSIMPGFTGNTSARRLWKVLTAA